MAYEKLNLADGQKFTAEHVAHIEDGIVVLSEEKIGFDPTKQGLPIMYMWGDTTGEDKDNEVTLTYRFGEHSGTLTRKWQGSGSIGLGQELGTILGDPNNGKMNYTIKVDTPFEAKEGWGEQKKYCLKANVADFSHARNLTAARLWGEMCANRTHPSPKLYKCPNWGAVDGFPVLLIVNDEYRGLYTMNIPKDGWMLGMPHEGATQEAIVCAEVGATFYGTPTMGTTYKLEYATDEDNAGWVQESIAALWTAVQNNDSTEIETRLDVDSAIDYLLAVAKCTGGDALSRNYLLHTYDGTKWAFTVYDADTWFGIAWGGDEHVSDDFLPTIMDAADTNYLMRWLVSRVPERIVERYNKLRGKVLSASNLIEMVMDFTAQIPKAVFDAEVARWPGIKTTATNDAHQIVDHIRAREPIIDAEIERLDAPMMAAGATWYNAASADAEMSTITDINFDANYTVTGNEEASWDCSALANGSIMAYRTGTVVTVKPTAHKYILLNTNSNFMFANDGANGASFSSLARITGTEMFTARLSTSMESLCTNVNKLTTPVYIPRGVYIIKNAYRQCWILRKPPVIPKGMLYINGAFHAAGLWELPEIPVGVLEITGAFAECAHAKNVPHVIPDSVQYMANAFSQCYKASGMMEIKAKNIVAYSGAFAVAARDTDGIVLVGSNTQLAELAATNADGKVTVLE